MSVLQSIKRLFQTRWMAAASLVVLAVAVVAACSDDTASEPVLAPEPTAAAAPEPEPEPAPEPAPEPEPEPVSLEGLWIDSKTTGQELAANVSETESACLASGLGDDDHELFQASTLIATVAGSNVLPLFAECLERDNFVLLSMGLLNAQNELTQTELSEESFRCITNAFRSSPEIVYVALGLEEHPPETIQTSLFDYYDCLTLTEQAGLQVFISENRILVEPVTGQEFLQTLTEDQVECLRSHTPEDIFDMIANSPSVDDNVLAQMPNEVYACYTYDALVRIHELFFIKGLGATSETSRNCVIEFLAENSEYMDLQIALSASAVRGLPGLENFTDEQIAGINDGSMILFGCLNAEELIRFQQVLVSFALPLASAPSS